MAEVILSSVANLIIETLGSAAVKKIGGLYGIRDELEQLEGTLSTIRAVLLDAERQQAHNNQVRLWLQRLEDVINDADDLVDGVATEGLRRQLMSEKNKVLKAVRTFCSSSNQLVFRSKLAGEIRRVQKRLAAISADRRDFKFDEAREEIVRPVRIMRETHSFVDEESVVGRVEDKRRVLELVLGNMEAEERVCVIPIFGMGGLGKTTLAQLVFNHEDVNEHFDVKIWVCVSDNFEVKEIVGLIVRYLVGTGSRMDDSTMEELLNTLKETLNGKRYLLVLDDVWNENHQKWQYLMGILNRCGVSGSKMITTTRSERVAKLTSNVVQPCRLGILSDEESWSLFEKMAFGKAEEPVEPDTLEIGKQIMKKCGGIPLAIRMIASMLSIKDPKTEWPSFLKKELSSLHDQQNDIFPTLKLSYDSLPSHLKHCFASCSLFLKDREIKVIELIDLWLGQGLIIVSLDDSQSPEEKGYEHFLELYSRCFFQEAVKNKHNKVKRCKMHDLVHDLALQVAGNKYVLLDRGKQENSFKEVRYVSYGEYLDGLPNLLLQAKRLRSLVRLYNVGSAFKASDLKGVVSNFKFLRMLDMRSSEILIVPNSMGKLKHLRYLDLSFSYIKSLPNSITKLVNLEILKLDGCRNLHKLPRDTRKLVNLRRLTLASQPSRYELCLPRGVSQLTNLQTLSCFSLSEDVAIASQSSKLDDLKGLKYLRGKFEIRGLKSGMETKGANLKEKEHITSISLVWSRNSRSDQQPERTLEGLQTHPNLKELSVEWYDGFKFPDWLSSLTNLTRLELKDFSNLKQLPSLDSLHFLKKMFLEDCGALESIITDFNGDGCSQALPVLPSLQQLKLHYLTNFRGWKSLNTTPDECHLSYFPSLTSLSIVNCSMLTSMPLYPSIRDLELKCANKKPFEQTASMSGECTPESSFYPLSLVRTIDVSCCSRSDVESFPRWMQGLSSLVTLAISEHKRPQVECQIVEFDSFRLKWMIEETDSHVEGNHVTWEIFSSVRALILEEAPILKYISIASQYLPFLENLEIKGQETVDFGSDSERSNTIKWEALASLRTVTFIELPKLVSLPEWLHRLTTLQKLKIRGCDSFTTIPNSVCELSSLKKLKIWQCPKIESFPESMSSLTSLQRLDIFDCPILEDRCQRETGEEWPKIRHIPDISISLAQFQ